MNKGIVGARGVESSRDDGERGDRHRLRRVLDAVAGEKTSPVDDQD
jgi:hypothetical protein